MPVIIRLVFLFITPHSSLITSGVSCPSLLIDFLMKVLGASLYGRQDNGLREADLNEA